jgi:hypothetical protein
MTILLYVITYIHDSPGQPFGAGLTLQNLVPFLALTQKVSKAKEIKAPTIATSLAIQVYQLRLFGM